MGGKSFIALKSTLDGVIESKDAAFKKAGKDIAIALSREGGNQSDTIDKLLKDLSDHDKFLIMKYAFMAMM